MHVTALSSNQATKPTGCVRYSFQETIFKEEAQFKRDSKGNSDHCASIGLTETLKSLVCYHNHSLAVPVEGNTEKGKILMMRQNCLES